jgi:hypothetical protein
MAMQTKVRPETLQDAMAGLKSLPAKDRAVTRTEALEAMRKELKAAHKNGYSIEELVAYLNDKGIKVQASTLRQVLSSPKRDRRGGDHTKAMPGATETQG